MSAVPRRAPRPRRTAPAGLYHPQARLLLPPEAAEAFREMRAALRSTTTTKDLTR